MLRPLIGGNEDSLTFRAGKALQTAAIVLAGIGMPMNTGSVTHKPRTVAQRKVDLPKVPRVQSAPFWIVNSEPNIGQATEYLASRVGDVDTTEFFSELANLNPMIPSHRDAMDKMQEAVNLYLPKNYGSQEGRLLQALTDIPQGVQPIISQLPNSMAKHDLDGDGKLSREEASNWWNYSLDKGNPFLVRDLHWILTDKAHSSTVENLRRAFDVIKRTDGNSNKLASVSKLLSEGIRAVS